MITTIPNTPVTPAKFFNVVNVSDRLIFAKTSGVVNAKNAIMFNKQSKMNIGNRIFFNFILYPLSLEKRYRSILRPLTLFVLL